MVLSNGRNILKIKTQRKFNRLHQGQACPWLHSYQKEKHSTYPKSWQIISSIGRVFGNPEKVIMEVNYSMSRAQNALMAKWQFRTRVGPMNTTYLENRDIWMKQWKSQFPTTTGLTELSLPIPPE